MAAVSIINWNEIPYIAKETVGSRFLATGAFYDQGDWHVYVPLEEAGKFIKLKGTPAEIYYFAKTPDQPEDIYFPFLDFLAQLANAPQVKPLASAVMDDLHNLAASFAKLKLIHDNAAHRQGASRMAATEIEYLLVLCRAIFDLLQEVVQKLWETVELADSSKKKKHLKKSFADMALVADTPRTVAEIMSQFGLPEALAACYARHAPLFIRLRKFRDQIVHGMSQVQILFVVETDFFIEKRLGTFLDLDIWSNEETRPNDLVPLTPALALLVHGTLGACNDFASVLSRTITFPPPIVPGMGLFMRGYFNANFAAIMRDAQERSFRGHSLISQESGETSEAPAAPPG